MWTNGWANKWTSLQAVQAGFWKAIRHCPTWGSSVQLLTSLFYVVSSDPTKKPSLQLCLAQVSIKNCYQICLGYYPIWGEYPLSEPFGARPKTTFLGEERIHSSLFFQVKVPREARAGTQAETVALPIEDHWALPPFLLQSQIALLYSKRPPSPGCWPSTVGWTQLGTALSINTWNNSSQTWPQANAIWAIPQSRLPWWPWAMSRGHMTLTRMLVFTIGIQ